MVMSNAEKCREYRKRLKLKNNAARKDIKSSAQRSREYRHRKKLLVQLEQKNGGPISWGDLKFQEADPVIIQANQAFSSILTKIKSGVPLEEFDLHLLQSRFVTTEEAETKCPHGTRLFNTDEAVNEYNHKILSAANVKTTSIASDVFTGCTSANQKTFLSQKLRKMSLSDTGGLPYETIFVPNVYYMITTDVDVSDGLANGLVGKLVHIERNYQGQIIVVWLEFPDSQKIGEKVRQRVAGHVAANKISKTAVPIGRKTATIPLNHDKTISVMRSHLPLICASAIMIHESQGTTCPKIVYEYDKNHPLLLVYLALSRVTNLQGLYITTKDNDQTFYHGRKASTAIISFQDAFSKFSCNRLESISQDVLDFINQRKELRTSTFSCQSLRAHCKDVPDSIIQNSNVSLSNETCSSNDDEVSLQNFNCMVQYKRTNVGAQGVASYQRVYDATNIITSMIDMTVREPEFTSSSMSSVGECCVSECRMVDGRKIVLLAVYIAFNQKLADIIDFLKQLLWPYTTTGREHLGGSEDKLPIILSGSFNVNFSREDLILIIIFLETHVNLTMNGDPSISITQHGTTIDAIFTRYVNDISTKFSLYFSYHRPLINRVPS